ncbi:MAG: hypothetical protein MR416_07450 [Lachnospiraceae bacterium]|nr:hypothetical protein [Lachnospiraceae bacterium]
MFTKALSSAVDENKGCIVLAQKQTLLADTIGRKPVTEMERSGIEVALRKKQCVVALRKSGAKAKPRQHCEKALSRRTADG